MEKKFPPLALDRAVSHSLTTQTLTFASGRTLPFVTLYEILPFTQLLKVLSKCPVEPMKKSESIFGYPERIRMR